MNQRRGLGLAALLLIGCVGQPGTPVPAPFSVGGVTARTVSLEARLVITPHRGLLAVVSPWGTADIDHVGLELFEGATSRGTLTVPQAQLGGVVRLNNLKPSTSYTLRARAWQDVAETVPIDNYDINAASCTTSFTTTTDDVLSLPGGIALKLRDKTFSGLGTGSFNITVGSVVASGTESLAVQTLGAVVTTLAGSTSGYLDGIGAAARFSSPCGLDLDSAGNLFVCDSDNGCIRKITPSGVVTTFAGFTTGWNSYGYQDGTGTAAKFSFPQSLAIDSDDMIYVADYANHRIRKITPAGVVTTFAGSTAGFADGVGVAAQFNMPRGIAVDSARNVYVSDHSNHRIRKITPAGVVTTIAGSTQGAADGTGISAQFNYPVGLVVDPAGNIYVADSDNNRVRRITAAGVVTTLAASGGWGAGVTAASFSAPTGITIDPAGSLYIAEWSGHKIVKVSNSGVLTTFAGSMYNFGVDDGIGAAAKFNYPRSIVRSRAGTLYVSDYGSNRIRKID